MYRVALATILVILAAYGLCVLYDDLVGDGPIHAPRKIGSDWVQYARQNATAASFAEFPDPHFWARLTRSRLILEQCSPEVHRWLLQLRLDNRIALSSDPSRNATWDYWTGTLTLHRGFFAESDGMKVAQIMHEYRHSRQNWAKRVRYTVSFAVYRSGRRAIVEQDAYLYEILALDAIGLLHYADEPASLYRDL